METRRMSPEEVERRGEALYEERIRAQVEAEENIGKMVIIDVETGEYEVDERGLTPARRMQSSRRNAALYGKRIGYDFAEAFGGAAIERVVPR